MTTPQFRHLITLSLAAAVLVWAPIVEAQSAADAKRTIRAQRKYYKEPGYIDAEIRYMRGTLLVTGWVGTEALVEQGTEIGESVKGVKDMRNRLVVKEFDVASPPDSEVLAKIDERLDADEDLARVRRKLEITADKGSVTIVGKVNDYSQVAAIIRSVRKVPGIVAINFDKLKW
ncbi:MAG: BON domain-containing protein [Myxococcota bacterium]|nr:BON domain-containing protein [Myxococcota bacterium]